MIYSAFVMDSETRRLLLFYKDHYRLWQTVHTGERRVPLTNEENDRELTHAFDAYFTITGDPDKRRVVTGVGFTLCITPARTIQTVYETGQILPWSLEETRKLNLEPRTRAALKKHMGILMFFEDADRDIWSPLQDFAHAAP